MALATWNKGPRCESMENESIGQRGMGINCKGSQDQTERSVGLQEEEEDIDESTDVSGLAVLLVFAHFLSLNKTEEDLQYKCAKLNFLPFPTNCVNLNIVKVYDNKI